MATIDTQNPRTWEDARLERAYDLIHPQSGGWGDLPLLDRIVDEIRRRAEIRLERGEYGELHEASWYDARAIDALDTCNACEVEPASDNPEGYCEDCHSRIAEKQATAGYR